MKNLTSILVVASNIITLVLTILIYKNTNYHNKDKQIIDTDSITTINIENKTLSGDTNAYIELRGIYADNYSSYDFLFWSIMMSNKYRYTPAYFDVFRTILHSFPTPDFKSLDSMDDETRTLALNYLIKAADNQYPQALEYASQYLNEKKYVYFKNNHYYVR